MKRSAIFASLSLVVCSAAIASCSTVLGFEELDPIGPEAGVGGSTPGDASPEAADASEAGPDVAPDVTADVADDVSTDTTADTTADVAADVSEDVAQDVALDVVEGGADVQDAAQEEAGCGDTTSNPDHCGRCNHSCLGGDCVDGVCQPITFVSVPDGAWGMAVDDTSVYVAIQLNNEVHRYDKATSAPLVQLAFTSTVSVPSWIAVDDQFMYWSNRRYSDGSIAACPLAGCTGDPPEIASMADRPNGVDTDGTKVYWAETAGGTVRRANQDGSDAETLYDGGAQMRPFLLDVHGGYVFFSEREEGRIARVPVGGGTVETMGTSSSPADVAVTDDWVFWTNDETPNGAVFRVPNENPPAGGHTAQPVAGNQDYPFGIDADANHVYWVATAYWVVPEGALRTCPVTGCSGQPVTLDDEIPYPIDVVADDEALYYSVYGIDSEVDGEIRMVAKP